MNSSPLYNNGLNAVILHTVDDARDFVLKKIDGYLLLSTSPSVDTYFKYESDYKSICLSSFLSYDQIQIDIEKSIAKTEHIIRQLDEQWADLLGHVREIENIHIFNTLYSFVIKYMYAPYQNILQAIRNAIDEYSIQKLFIYDLNGFSLLGSQISFMDLVKCIELNIPVQILSKSMIKKTSVFRKAWRSPLKAFSYLANDFKSKKFKVFDKSNPTILVCESLYDLDFMIDHLGGLNIAYYKNNALFPENSPFKIERKEKNKKVKILFEKEKHTLDDLIINEIFDHFNRNINAYIEAIKYLDKINKKYPIQIGLSGNAATYGVKPLILEYLRKKDIPVVISQHGFNYGIQDPYGMHFYSDFNRCDYFISYGFHTKDLDVLYQKRENAIKCEVLPLGSTRLKPIRKRLKGKIDILYPLMNNISMLHQGLFRIKPDILTDIQEKLLLYLDSKRGFNIIVKPFLNYNDFTCSVLPILRRLKNIKVKDNIHFKESFRKYNVASVLIDHISSPMAEAIPYDVEIFALGNEADKIESDALGLLKKRVHYSEKIDELIDLIDRQLDNKLPLKRDRLFMDRYLLQKNAEFNIETFIKGHINKSCAVS